jgi:nucleoside-diphosphate-sugar epimerase
LNILLTGASGFIGRHLVCDLEKQDSYRLFYLTRQNSSLAAENPPPEVIFWDDFDAKYLSEHNIGYIIHLAGLAHAEAGKYTSEDYLNVNTRLTEKLFDAFLQSTRTKQFLFFSSVKAVKDHLGNESLTEQTEPTPSTPYGVSKLKAEEYLRSHERAGKEVFILRPCMVYGKGNKGNLDLLAGILAKNLPFPLGAYHNQRSFLYIENLSFMVAAILNGKVTPGTYNLADSTCLSTLELVQVIKATTGSRTPIWRIPKLVIRVMAKLGDVLPIPLNTARLEKLTENYIVDNSELLKELGQPLPFDTRQGLKSTFG